MSYQKEPTDDEGNLLCPYRCDNCEETFTLSQLKAIHNCSERVADGEEVPSGECPECGCLCHRIKYW